MDTAGDRVRNAQLRGKITGAAQAAERIRNGYKVGASGFTGAGCPKEVPRALAGRVRREKPALLCRFFGCLFLSPAKTGRLQKTSGSL